MAMERIYVTTPQIVLKGAHQGENLARCICFPIDGLKEQYGEGTWTIVFRRPFESDPYVVANQEEVGDYAVWGMDATDTAVAGEGRAELRYYVDDTLCKTDVYAVLILPSLGETGDAPSPYEDIIDTVAGYAAEARDAADEAGSVVSDAVAELQAELDEAISGATVDSEVINARVDSEGTTYSTLKQRLDTENSDLKNQITTLENLEKSRGFTPEQIQIIAAGGHADDYFSIGDIIYIDWTDNTPATPVTYSVPHVVVHFGDVEDENGTVHKNAMWLMWMYATPQAIQFDHPEWIAETETTFQSGYYYYVASGDGGYTEVEVTAGDTIPEGTTYYKHVRSGMAGRLRYGSNDWSQSAYRQWLNSDGGKGEWWTAQHDSDVAPDQADTVPGFLTGYTEDWKAIFKPIKVTTALNTVCDGGVDVVTYDKFFLPSLEQMYGSPQKSGVEGDVWEYWIEETGMPSRSNGSSTNTNPARQIPSITAPDGAAVTCRLRSAHRSTTNHVWNVNAAGYLSYGSASYASRALPACVIY